MISIWLCMCISADLSWKDRRCLVVKNLCFYHIQLIQCSWQFNTKRRQGKQQQQSLLEQAVRHPLCSFHHITNHAPPSLSSSWVLYMNTEYYLFTSLFKCLLVIIAILNNYLFSWNCLLNKQQFFCVQCSSRNLKFHMWNAWECHGKRKPPPPNACMYTLVCVHMCTVCRHAARR